MQRDVVDAYPRLTVSDNADWSHAINIRDSIAQTSREALAGHGIEAMTVVSSSGNYPPWYKIEAWLRDAPHNYDARERNELTFTVDTKPYRKFSHVTTVKLTKGKKTYVWPERTSVSDMDIEQWSLFATGKGPVPQNYRPIRDAFAKLFGFGSNQVRSEFKPALATPANLLLMVACGLFILGYAFIQQTPALSVALASIALVCLIASFIVRRGRQRGIQVPLLPPVPPRDTSVVDTWHAVVPDVGADFANIRNRIVTTVFRACADVGVTCSGETYAFRTPTSFDERERFVISKGQAIVHIHIYRFGDDIFVGWDALLNWAKWNEKATGLVRAVGKTEIEYRDLRPGLYVPNQFDVIDLNSLSALVHRCIKQEVVAILKEKKIDQEIDFRIIRGDRDAALDKEKRTGDGKKAQKRGWGAPVAQA